MDKQKKKEIYAKICEELTKYEQAPNSGECNMGALHEFYSLLVGIKSLLEYPKEVPTTVYVGRWDLLEGGIEDVESFSEDDAIDEIKRERALYDDALIDTYTFEEFEAQFNNDLDEHNPFSLHYWIKIF